MSKPTYVWNGSAWVPFGGATVTDTNYYPTSASWTGGTTSGPTGTISGTGMTDVPIPAIPSASGTASGIVTTGAQTFAGAKTFSSTITGSITGNAGTVTNGVYTTDTATVTNTMLAGSIANNKLSNSSISINSASTALGGTVTLYAGTTTLQTSSGNQALTGISSITLPGATSGTAQIIPTSAAGTGTVITLPATSGTVYVSSGTDVAIADGGTGASTAPNALANFIGFTTTATAAGTTTLTNTSSYYQVFTGSTTQTVKLPVTSTLSTGWSFHIVNNSTGNLTVQSSGSNTVVTVIPGVTAMLTCVATGGTTASDWEAGITDFSTYTGTGDVMLSNTPVLSSVSTVGGGGAEGGQLDFARTTDGAAYWHIDVYGSTSTPDLRFLQDTTNRMQITGATGLVSIGAGSLGRGAPVTKTGNFTVADTENWIICNRSGANMTITLPTASSYTGREIMIKNLIQATYTVISASSNVVPLNSATAGTAILSAGANKWASLVSDGTNWVIMAGNI